MLGRAGAAQQQELVRARRHAARPHGAAVLVDQRVFGAVLPDRDGAPLLQGDIERVGQAALDGGRRDPVDRLEPLARAPCRSMPSSEIAGAHVQRRQDRVALDIVAALDGDVGQLERRHRADRRCAIPHRTGSAPRPASPRFQAHQPPAPPHAQQHHGKAQQQRLAPDRTAGRADGLHACACGDRSRGAAARRSWRVSPPCSRRPPRMVDHPGHELRPGDAGPLGLLGRQRQRRHAGLGVELEHDQAGRPGLWIVPAEVGAASVPCSPAPGAPSAPIAWPARRPRPGSAPE